LFHSPRPTAVRNAALVASTPPASSGSKRGSEYGPIAG